MKLCRRLSTPSLILAWVIAVGVPVLVLAPFVAFEAGTNWVVVLNLIIWCITVNDLRDHYARIRFDRMVERVDQERAR